VTEPRFGASEAWALEQDGKDPLAWCRNEFEHPRDDSGSPLLYFCGNSLGLMPKAARALVDAQLDDWARLAVEAHLGGRNPWYSYHERFRESAARLVGARTGEVVVMNSLTVNLHLMMTSFYRPTASRWKVLIEESAFPSDVYAVASHLEARGIDPAEGVVLARPRPSEAVLRTEDLETLLVERGHEFALVLLPGVQYFTGQLLDMAGITAAAQRAGCAVGFDLAHAVGNVPLQLHDWNVDFAVWCSYKYLNGGPGAVGGCFVHERHGTNRTLPRLAGWWGNDPATRFRMHLEPKFVPVSGADGWQLSNPPILSMAPLRASFDLFDQVGMAALRAKSAGLTGYLEYLLADSTGAQGEILTPIDPASRGCQLSIRVPSDGPRLFDALRARGVVGDFRQPDVIRLAPVPLYNSYREVWLAAQIIRELLGAG
jgi:kynureninase